MTTTATERPADSITTEPAANPRNSWPDWTEADYWTPTDLDVYEPTPAEQAEAAQLLNDPTQVGWGEQRPALAREVRWVNRPFPNNNLTDADIHPHGVC